ncbi:MAG: endonuclease NucS domain-containing protein [candidate division WOR-3 bacterium]
MKNYFHIRLGEKNKYAEQAYKENFIGVGFIYNKDFTNRPIFENWRDFNKEYIPAYLKEHPDKSKVAAGLACGMLWTVIKYLQIGDIVLCPDGKGNYYVGEINGNYMFVKGNILPHRRSVQWFSKIIKRDEMSDELKHSTGSIGTLSDITKHADEIEALIAGSQPQRIVTTDKTIEDPSLFALEQHLEDFLVQNWRHTELGKKYDLFEEEDETVGQQYPTDTGKIDILAISKDKKEILVIELKRGRSSDVVVGQIQRYMGYVKDELADTGQSVRGIIIAHEDDIRIRRALSVTQNIDFYVYRINFKLEKIEKK